MMCGRLSRSARELATGTAFASHCWVWVGVAIGRQEGQFASKDISHVAKVGWHFTSHDILFGLEDSQVRQVAHLLWDGSLQRVVVEPHLLHVGEFTNFTWKGTSEAAAAQ